MIVIFSHAHPSISKGGAEVSAYTLFLGLGRLGVPAAFVATVPERDLPRLVLGGSNEYVVGYAPETYDHLFHHAAPQVVQEVLLTVRRLSPSALVFHHFLFLGINTVHRLCSEYGCPKALVLHEFLAICHHHGQMVTHPKKKLCTSADAVKCATCFPEYRPEEFQVRRSAFIEAMSLVDRVISPSAFLASRFAEWGLPQSRLSVIENGLARLDPHGETAPAPKPPARGGGGPVVFGYFGQINPFKGIDLILSALDQVGARDPDIVVRVHGNVVGLSDELRRRFDLASGETGRIDYYGPYDNSDVIALMEACDYVVMASKWWENSPVVIQEAFAAGRPVVAPALGGMAEKVVDGVCGHHFKFNDAGDLARVMLACAQSHRSGQATYRFPRPASAIDMATAYLDTLQMQGRTDAATQEI